MTVPADLEEWHKADLKWSFLSVLADLVVKKHMLLKDSDYKNLGIDARKIEKQLCAIQYSLWYRPYTVVQLLYRWSTIRLFYRMFWTPDFGFSLTSSHTIRCIQYTVYFLTPSKKGS